MMRYDKILVSTTDKTQFKYLKTLNMWIVFIIFIVCIVLVCLSDLSAYTVQDQWTSMDDAEVRTVATNWVPIARRSR